MARSVDSASNRRSMSQRALWSPTSPPLALNSAQVLAMPYRRKAFSSAPSSRMISLLGTQAVVATGVGHRRLLDLQRGRHRFGQRRLVEPGNDIEHMLHTDHTRFEHQLDGDEHRVEPGLG